MGAAAVQVPGINHYEVVIEAVYDYWRGKHQRAGRPLIQRLWYEPPWDRKKAAQRLASSAADGEGGGGGAADDGPFYAQDSPVALAGIRKRRMDPEEAKARFQEIRWVGGWVGGWVAHSSWPALCARKFVWWFGHRGLGANTPSEGYQGTSSTLPEDWPASDHPSLLPLRPASRPHRPAGVTWSLRARWLTRCASARS